MSKQKVALIRISFIKFEFIIKGQIQYFLMNPSSIFYPYWPLVNTQNVFPFFQILPFEKHLQPAQIFLANKTIEQTIVSSNKFSQTQNQFIFPGRNIVDKRKSIKKVKQDKNYAYRYQDKNRNIYSNILKSFVIKLRQDIKFQTKCQEYTHLFNSQLELQDFIEFLDQNFHQNKTYISPIQMKKVFKKNQKKPISKCIGFLLSKYLREWFTLVLLASQRIQKHSKMLQIKKARELWELIFGKGDQNEQKSID